MNRLLIILFLFLATGIRAQHYEFREAPSLQDWQHIGKPDSTKYAWCRGCLRLYGGVFDLNEGKDFTFTGLPLPDSPFTYETKLTIIDTFDSDEAGICLYRSREAYVQCCVNDYRGDRRMKLRLQLVSHRLLLNDVSIGTVRTVWIRVSLSKTGDKYNFHYSTDHQKWQWLQSVELRLLSPAATGSDSAMLIGLYCFTGNSKFNAGYTYADFEYVDFQK